MAGRKEPITIGEKFGLLTIVSYHKKINGRNYWNCRCECGEVTTVEENHLRSGHTRSCGCLRAKYKNSIGNDLVGQRFGRLAVLELHHKQGNKKYWKCLCECGQISIVQEGHLKNGHTKSCGCMKIEHLKAKAYDLTGRRFGRLVVLCAEEDGYWRCLCDCGKECIVYKEYLTSGNTRSCGCLQTDTRKENMRTAIHFVDGTCIERIASKRLFANNTTGYTGVYKRKNGKYRAIIGFQGKKINIGTFLTIEEAVQARQEKEEELYKPIIEKFYGSG